MNAIRQTQQLNRRELENATPPSASWHADYRDTAWIYVGGLPLDLSEGDVVTIFSQFGSPTHLNLIRDRETGKSKGFGFLKYEDQRSCDLAVDNLTGADVLGRLLRVDHTRYKKRDDEDENTYKIDRLEAELEMEKQAGKRASESERDESDDEEMRRKRRKKVRDAVKKLAITENGEDEDPMKDYLAREKGGLGEKHRERRHRHRDRDRGQRDVPQDEVDREERTHRRHHEDRDSKHDREIKGRRDPKERRRRSYSRGSNSDRSVDRYTGRDDGKSLGRRVRSRSRGGSPSYEIKRRRDSTPESLNKGKSSKPGRLKFKGKD